MEGVVRGDVVIVDYPFSDLSQTKRRPALVISLLPRNDVLLCQITSRSITDEFGLPLTAENFISGKLSHPSNIRPSRLFTADRNILLYRAGHVSDGIMIVVSNVIVRIVTASEPLA